ncbi:MAG: hypothetical protein RLZZ502_314 [Pseudomonadota bacterium]|jgi:predicted porin
MQLSKLFVAVSAALVGSAAMAQTASVTLYGVVDTGIASNTFKVSNTAGGAKVTTLTEDEGRSARWGMRGTEKIGALNANFNLEGGFGPDTGAAPTAVLSNGASASPSLFNRRATVGLSGGFGAVDLGYSLTPFDDVLGMGHQMGANSWENLNNGVSGGPGFAKTNNFRNYYNNCDSLAFDARYGNSISYESPVMGGFSARTQYALLGENTVSGPKCFGWDTRVRGNIGPVTAGLAYAKHGNFNISGALIDADAIRGAVKATFGMFEIDANVERANYKPQAATGGKYTYTSMGFGAVANLGSTRVGAQYHKRDNGVAYLYNVTAAGASTAAVPATAFNNSAASIANWKQGGGQHFTVKVDHSLSSRTRVYAYFSTMKNELNHFATANNQATVQNLVAGIWHTF